MLVTAAGAEVLSCGVPVAVDNREHLWGGGRRGGLGLGGGRQ